MPKQKRRKNRMIRLAALLITMMLAVSAQPAITYAADDISSETGSITMDYPVSDANFKLYKVGEYDQAGSYNLYDKFSGYSVDLTDSNAAQTLADYVTADEIEADAATVSDANGQVYFGDLVPGVYLLLGETVVKDDVKYIPKAVMLQLPQWKKGELQFGVKIEGKFSKETVKKTEISVTKIWKNDSESSRPVRVTVQLLKDGKVQEEAELTKSNDWTKEWKDLDGKSTWTVNEKAVTSGYKVAKTVSGTNVVLTNTKTTTSGGGTTTTTLPQTGQLWWPVGVLAAAGLLLILIGLLCRRRS